MNHADTLYNWKYRPLIEAITGFAALLHDWGKATDRFQAKLMKAEKPNTGMSKKNKPSEKSTDSSEPDALRHEWISCLMFNCLIKSSVNDSQALLSDDAWLQALLEKGYDQTALLDKVAAFSKPESMIFENLPPLAKAIGWVILTHHLMPGYTSGGNRSTNQPDPNIFCGKNYPGFAAAIDKMHADFGYILSNDKTDMIESLKCRRGLLGYSAEWTKKFNAYLKRLHDNLRLFQSIQDGQSIRYVLEHARLALMLADYAVSSDESSDKTELPQEKYLWANTSRHTGKRKQTLEKHIMGVFKKAVNNVGFLVRTFEGALPGVETVGPLLKKSPTAKYRWQDTAVAAIAQWRKEQVPAEPRFGFFGVNVAGTGYGKTLANAKIALALSETADSMRFTLGLGLRTLTLQTGEEYKNRLKLDHSELGVVIGSNIIQALAEKNRSNQKDGTQSPKSGVSESQEELLDESCNIDFALPPDNALKIVLNNGKAEKLLYSPVLVCTVDHLIGAVDTFRGGRYMLPYLRLMSSDIIIDEIDDFTDLDLVTLGRLIFLSGMFGRKVCISSATIPPAMAQGYFESYAAGWKIFAENREAKLTVGGGFFDENGATVKTVDLKDAAAQTHYNALSETFLRQKARTLATAPVKRMARFISCEHLLDRQTASDTAPTLEDAYSELFRQTCGEMHRSFAFADTQTGLQVSFGLVRTANIAFCVSLAQYLIDADWGEDTDVRVMAYHSRLVLPVRNKIETVLDGVLKRSTVSPLEHPVVRQCLRSSRNCKPNAKHLIFIVVATPVEEVGRDHDFDWAVVEPSSLRSIIQLAGRILRHRAQSTGKPNIAVMSHNLKGLQSQNADKPVFTRPGFESKNKQTDGTYRYRLRSNNVIDLLDTAALQTNITAAPRLVKPENIDSARSFADLEHQVTADLLTDHSIQPAHSLGKWVTGYLWVTGFAQRAYRFRDSNQAPDLVLYYAPQPGTEDFTECRMLEKSVDKNAKDFNIVDNLMAITLQGNAPVKHPERFWFEYNYPAILAEIADIRHAETSAGTNSQNRLVETAQKYAQVIYPGYWRNKSKPTTFSLEWGLITS